MHSKVGHVLLGRSVPSDGLQVRNGVIAHPEILQTAEQVVHHPSDGSRFTIEVKRWRVQYVYNDRVNPRMEYKTSWALTKSVLAPIDLCSKVQMNSIAQSIVKPGKMNFPKTSNTPKEEFPVAWASVWNQTGPLPANRTVPKTATRLEFSPTGACLVLHLEQKCSPQSTTSHMANNVFFVVDCTSGTVMISHCALNRPHSLHTRWISPYVLGLSTVRDNTSVMLGSSNQVHGYDAQKHTLYTDELFNLWDMWPMKEKQEYYDAVADHLGRQGLAFLVHFVQQLLM